MTALIRQAEEQDLPKLVAMGRRFHCATGFGASVPYDPESAMYTFGNLMVSPNAELLIADDDEPVGFVGGTVSPVYTNSNYLVAHNLFWWLEPKHRGEGLGTKLLQAFEEWAYNMGADVVVMSSLDTLAAKKMTKFYEGLGYRPSEHLFSKPLQEQEREAC